MDFNKVKKVFNDKGITEFEIYHYKQESVDISTFDGEVDDNTCANENELSIRGVYNGHITTVNTQLDSDDEIENVANQIIANTSVTESNDPYIIYEGSKEYATLEEVSNDYDEYSQADLIALLKKIESYFKNKCEYVVSTSAGVSVSTSETSIKNSKGLNVSRKSNEARVFVQAIIKKDGDVKQGFAMEFVDNFKDLDMNKMYVDAVERTVASIGAETIPSNSYPVVFENKMALSLLSCFTSMFSADSVIKKLSILANKMGTKVFGDNITFTDEPLLDSSHTKFTFDDEGVATKKKTLVENGVLKSYLHNLRTAKMMGVEPTGNGFKFGNGAPTNLCLKNDDVSFEDAIKDIKDGILITNMMGQHAGVNLSSGTFNLQSSGFKIVNGKIDKPVTLIIVSGNIVDLLNNVVCVSNDVESRNHISSGSIYVKSLNVSGK